MIITPGAFNRRAEFYHQLGSMITAGVPLTRALEMAVRNPSARKIVPQLMEHLKAGLTFTDSMKRIHGWLPEFDIALLSVGEQSGRLDVSFRLLATYYATRAQIIRDAIAGSIVTVATLHVFLLIFPLGLLISLVQGIMAGNYSQCMPFVEEKAIAFGALYGVALLLIFSSQGQRNEHWRGIMESLVRWIPVLRKAQRYLALSRLSAALEALVSSGVSIVKAWPMAVAASGSPRLRRVTSGWTAELDSGKTPAELVARTHFFPEMFMNLYHTGEISGKLDESLQRLQRYYQEEGFRALRLFTRMMNGIIYGLVALMVAIYVIRFWIHYYASMMNAF
jgi:type II secretory pathway component PulF